MDNTRELLDKVQAGLNALSIVEEIKQVLEGRTGVNGQRPSLSVDAAQILLVFVANDNRWLTPKSIANRTGLSKTRVTEACQNLYKQHFRRQTKNGVIRYCAVDTSLRNVQ